MHNLLKQAVVIRHGKGSGVTIGGVDVERLAAYATSGMPIGESLGDINKRIQNSLNPTGNLVLHVNDKNYFKSLMIADLDHDNVLMHTSKGSTDFRRALKDVLKYGAYNYLPKLAKTYAKEVASDIGSGVFAEQYTDIVAAKLSLANEMVKQAGKPKVMTLVGTDGEAISIKVVMPSYAGITYRKKDAAHGSIDLPVAGVITRLPVNPLAFEISIDLHEIGHALDCTTRHPDQKVQKYKEECFADLYSSLMMARITGNFDAYNSLVEPLRSMSPGNTHDTRLFMVKIINEIDPEKLSLLTEKQIAELTSSLVEDYDFGPTFSLTKENGKIDQVALAIVYGGESPSKMVTELMRTFQDRNVSHREVENALSARVEQTLSKFHSLLKLNSEAVERGGAVLTKDKLLGALEAYAEWKQPGLQSEMNTLNKLEDKIMFMKCAGPEIGVKLEDQDSLREAYGWLIESKYKDEKVSYAL
ncbi:hypothetical protein [Neptuniibacter sp. QD37_11]|uniref:hypothetical protein n=1 Tax=Neptuniibacter sp. QD37_11 TaxID=3398209 RepID=UPI0039F4BEDA